MRKFAWLGLVALLAFAVGCTSTAEREDETMPSGTDSGVITTPDTGTQDTTGQPIVETPQPAFDPDCPPPCEFTRDAITDPSSALAQKIVYFDFDQSVIREEFVDVIAAHGRYLATYPDVNVRLEGHTDERGSREYNIALGERRSVSVRRQLLLQGVDANQMEVISYGEELPAALGHDEEAWGQNRRVEIVYQ
ncbi:MAG: peptidoglycan-associated lipoprotein Pal [Gammaproteobacteria bacterium]|nr:peptidoglycan-associated lipoprotein Pal [Gammaproteobacteria bacterium]